MILENPAPENLSTEDKYVWTIYAWCYPLIALCWMPIFYIASMYLGEKEIDFLKNLHNFDGGRYNESADFAARFLSSDQMSADQYLALLKINFIFFMLCLIILFFNAIKALSKRYSFRQRINNILTYLFFFSYYICLLYTSPSPRDRG